MPTLWTIQAVIQTIQTVIHAIQAVIQAVIQAIRAAAIQLIQAVIQSIQAVIQAIQAIQAHVLRITRWQLCQQYRQYSQGSGVRVVRVHGVVVGRLGGGWGIGVLLSGSEMGLRSF